MLAIATYIEEVKPGWRSYDKYLLHNLDLAFKVDRHYWIARTEKDADWYYEKRPNKEKCDHIDISVRSLVARLKLTEPKTKLINVQPYERIGHLDGNENLYEFMHPKNACYIFGPNHGEIEIANTPYNIWIPSPSSSFMYSAAAVATVLSDRANHLSD